MSCFSYLDAPSSTALSLSITQHETTFQHSLHIHLKGLSHILSPYLGIYLGKAGLVSMCEYWNKGSVWFLYSRLFRAGLRSSLLATLPLSILYNSNKRPFDVCHGGETLFEGLPIRGAAQWSRDTAVACCCCCDGADAAATELMLRAARVPPRGAAASLLEVLLATPRGGTRRRRPVECRL